MGQTSSRSPLWAYDTMGILITRFIAGMMLFVSASALAEIPKLNAWVNGNPPENPMG